MAKRSRSLSVPPAMQATYDATVAVIEEFCQEHLNEEYAQLCREMAAALARKRPSPLLGGKVGTWACGIVYAAGQVNFLFDRSQDVHLRADDLCEWFGLRPSTGGNKAAEIRRTLKIRGQFDPDWTLPSKLGHNPYAWYIEVNGIIVDARRIPRELQEEAFRLGLIPYVPADQ